MTTAVNFCTATEGYEADKHRLTDMSSLAHCGETGPPGAFSAHHLRSER